MLRREQRRRENSKPHADRVVDQQNKAQLQRARQRLQDTKERRGVGCLELKHSRNAYVVFVVDLEDRFRSDGNKLEVRIVTVR